MLIDPEHLKFATIWVLPREGGVAVEEEGKKRRKRDGAEKKRKEKVESLPCPANRPHLTFFFFFLLLSFPSTFLLPRYFLPLPKPLTKLHCEKNTLIDPSFALSRLFK